MENYKYIAFISYNHHDKSVAKKLQREIYNFRLPTKLRESYPNLPVKVGNVFRDDTHLTSGGLSYALEAALENSKFLIVVCSKETFESGWVQKEIAYFKKLGKEQYIIPYIIDSTIDVGKYLSDVGLTQQLAIVSGVLSINKLIACLLGVDLITLTKCVEDFSEQRKRRQRYIISCVLIVVFGLSYIAYNKYRDYRMAQLEKLIEQIEHSIDVGDFGTARVYAIDAYDNYKDYLKGELHVDFERVARKLDFFEQLGHWEAVGRDFSNIRKIEVADSGDSLMVYEEGVSTYFYSVWDIKTNKCIDNGSAKTDFLNKDELPQWAAEVAAYDVGSVSPSLADDFKLYYPDAPATECIKIYEVDNYKLFVTTNYGIFVYDELMKKHFSSIQLPAGIIDVHFSEESSMIAVATVSKIYVADLNIWFPHLSFTDEFEAISISPNGRYVLLNFMGADGKYIIVWDLVNNTEYSRLDMGEYIHADIYDDRYCIIYYPDRVAVVGLDLSTIYCESEGDIDSSVAFVSNTYYPDDSVIQFWNKMYEVETLELVDTLENVIGTFAPKFHCVVDGESYAKEFKMNPETKKLEWVEREDFLVSVYEMKSHKLKGEFDVNAEVRDIAVNSSGDIAVLAGENLYISNISSLDDVKSYGYGLLCSDLETFGDYFTLETNTYTVVVDNVYGKELLNVSHPLGNNFLLDFALDGGCIVLANGYWASVIKFRELDEIIAQWR